MNAPVNPRGLGRADRLARMEEVLAKRPPAAGRPRPRRSGNPRLQRLTALFVGLLLIAFLPMVGLAVATRPDSAQRIIVRAVPAITELDGLVALHGSDLQAAARTDSHTPVVMPEFPINVSLSATQVAKASPQGLELLFAQHAAAAVYQRGLGAFALADARPANRTGPILSSQWAMHEALDLLNVRTHWLLTRAAVLLLVVTLVLVLLFSLQVGNYGRLVGLGACGLLATIVAGLLTGAAWLFVQFNSNGSTSALGSAAWGMIADVAWTMLLVDLVAAICSIALIVTGYFFARLEGSEGGDTVAATEPSTPTAVPITRRGTRPLDRLPKPPPRSN